MTVKRRIAKIRRLMLPEQPQSIDPLHLAKNKEHIEGFLSLDSLGRLEGVLLDNEGQVQYSLSFDFDAAGICLIESKIGAKLSVKCQRCLDPMGIEIKKSSILGVYRNFDEFKKLKNDYEPFQLDEELIVVKTLVEEEVVLAIPLAPMHADKNCVKGMAAKALKKTKKRNPFSILKKLKNDKV